MKNLPDEVLSEIFIRLLAKQLAQMRSVCKSWKALLFEPSFIKSHLRRSIHHNDQILLFFDLGFSFDHCPFTARPSRSPHLELPNFIKLPDSPQYKSTSGHVIGSVNGLICFYYKLNDDNYVLQIWNPSLSAVLTLPPYSFPSHLLLFGFGYDPKTDDYKLVKFRNYLVPPKLAPQSEVYSMKKGSWVSISQKFPFHMRWLSNQNEVCVDGHNGHLHWIASTGLVLKPQTIVGFNLSAETFHEIPLPDSVLHHYSTVLGVLGGKVCVMSKVVRDGGEWEVWVMDEYGVAESWVKNLVFSRFSGEITPYGFTLQNKLLFEVDDEDGRFALYNPIAAKTKIFRIILGGSYMNKVIEYVDSLVWITTVNQLQI